MTLPNRKYKIYIVGEIPSPITMETIQKFSEAQRCLFRHKAETVNPLTNILNATLAKGEAFKRNIMELVNSNAIYLLDEKNEFYINSVELRLAFALNLTIIHEPYVLPKY